MEIPNNNNNNNNKVILRTAILRNSQSKIAAGKMTKQQWKYHGQPRKEIYPDSKLRRLRLALLAGTKKSSIDLSKDYTLLSFKSTEL